MAMLAWLPSSPTAASLHAPLIVSRPRTVRPRSVKKAIVASRSRTAIPTFSSLMGMRGTLSRLRVCLRPLGDEAPTPSPYTRGRLLAVTGGREAMAGEQEAGRGIAALRGHSPFAQLHRDHAQKDQHG